MASRDRPNVKEKRKNFLPLPILQLSPYGGRHTDRATVGHPVLANMIQYRLMLRSSAGTGLVLQLFLLLYSYLLTSCSMAFRQKITGSQLVKKISEFYGTRRFITAFTSAHHLSLSSARKIQSLPQHRTTLRSILILSSHLSLFLPSGLLRSRFPTKTINTPLFPHSATCPAHLIILDFITPTILG